MAIAKEAAAQAPEIMDEAKGEERPRSSSSSSTSASTVETALAANGAAATSCVCCGPARAGRPALRTAGRRRERRRRADIAYRGRGAPVPAILDEGVDHELVQRAMAGNEAVLVEIDPVGPVIVGIVQRRVPDTRGDQGAQRRSSTPTRSCSSARGAGPCASARTATSSW